MDNAVRADAELKIEELYLTLDFVNEVANTVETHKETVLGSEPYRAIEAAIAELVELSMSRVRPGSPKYSSPDPDRTGSNVLSLARTG